MTDETSTDERTKVLRVAVVGLGGIGQTHARCYHANPNAELVAVCDLDPERVEAVAAQYDVPGHSDCQRMLAETNIDAVSVATAGAENGGHHYEPASRAIAAAKHVLVEKPLSNDLAEARRLVRQAKDRGVLLGVNFNHRFNPAAERAKRLQRDGELGEVLFINVALRIDNPNDGSPWFHLRALHPHSIDVMRYFGGPITRVHTFATKAPGRSSWSTVSVNVQFASGAVGHLTGSYDASPLHPVERCEIGGSEGRVVIENVFERLEFFPRRSPEKLVMDNSIMGGMQGFDDTFRNRIDVFVEQVRSGGPLDASGDDGLAAQEAIEAAIRSAETGAAEEVGQLVSGH